MAWLERPYQWYMNNEHITDDDILKLQAHAVATNDLNLLDLCYRAMGYGRRVQIVPLAGEVHQARRKCAALSKAIHLMETP